MEFKKNVLPLLHNVYSPQKVLEAARLVYGLGYKNFVVTKASGAAAQSGVPEAQKIALRKGANLFYLADLDDAIELFRPSRVYLFVPEGYADEEFEPRTAREQAESSVVMLVFGGAEPGLSKRELEKGTPVYIPGLWEHSTVGTLAIALYLLELDARISRGDETALY